MPEVSSALATFETTHRLLSLTPARVTYELRQWWQPTKRAPMARQKMIGSRPMLSLDEAMLPPPLASSPTSTALFELETAASMPEQLQWARPPHYTSQTERA